MKKTLLKKIQLAGLALLLVACFALPNGAEAVSLYDKKVTEKTVTLTFRDVLDDSVIQVKLYNGSTLVSTTTSSKPQNVGGYNTITHTLDVYNLVRGITYSFTAVDTKHTDTNSVNDQFNTVTTDTRAQTGKGNWYYSNSYDLKAYETETAKSYYRFDTQAACEAARAKQIQDKANISSGWDFTPCFQYGKTTDTAAPPKAEFQNKMAARTALTRYYFEYQIGASNYVYGDNNFTMADCEKSKANLVPGPGVNAKLTQDCFPWTAFGSPQPSQYQAPSVLTKDPAIYKLLAPIPGFGDEFDTTKSFGEYFNLIIKLLIAFTAGLSVIMIVVGGIQYMSTDAFSEKAEGKQRIVNAVIGLLISLASYVILYTLNPDLVDINIGLDKVKIVAADEESDYDPTPEYQTAKSGDKICPNKSIIKSDGATAAIMQGSNWLTDAAIGDSDQRAKLTAMGVKVKNKACRIAGEGKCTSVAFNANASTFYLGKLQKLKNAHDMYIAEVTKTDGKCVNVQGEACHLLITGGSECWMHQTHGPGTPNFDMRVDPALTLFVTSNATSAGEKTVAGQKGFNSITPVKTSKFPAKCTEYRVPGYGRFLAETVGCTPKGTAAHWHIELNG